MCAITWLISKLSNVSVWMRKRFCFGMREKSIAVVSESCSDAIGEFFSGAKGPFVRFHFDALKLLEKSLAVLK